MADINFQRVQCAEKEVKELFLTFSVSGGVAVMQPAHCIKSVVRNSAGDFTITLQKFHSLKACTAIIQDSTPRDIKMQIKTQDIVGSETPNGIGTIEVVFVTGITPTDYNGMTVLMRFDVKHTGLKE